MARRRLARAFMSAVAAFIFPDAEIVFDQTLGVVRIGAEAKAGGHILLRESEYGVNLKYFGAKGDGVADDTDAIIAADAYATEHGRNLYFPKGRYAVRPNAIFRAGCPWEGQDKNAAVICPIAGTVFWNLSGLVSCQYRTGCSTTRLGFDLTGGVYPDGTGNPGNIIWAINFQMCSDWEFFDCKIRGIGAQRIGVAVDGGEWFTIDNNRFFATASNRYNQSVNLSAATDIPTHYSVSYNLMRGSGLFSNGAHGTVKGNRVVGYGFGAGLAFGPSPGCTFHTITENICNGGWGVDVNGVHPNGIECWSAYSVISNNNIFDNIGNGIGNGGYAVRITDNELVNNAKVSANGYSAIGMNSIAVGPYTYYASDCYVGNNSMFDTHEAKLQQYGYAEFVSGGPALSGNHVVDNKIAGVAVAPYRLISDPVYFKGPQAFKKVNCTVPLLAAGASYDEAIVMAGARTQDKADWGFSGDSRGYRVDAHVLTNNIVLTVTNISGAPKAAPAGQQWTIWLEKAVDHAGV